MRACAMVVMTTTIVILSLAGSALAQDLVGKQAPELNAKEWLNTEGNLTLKDLEGSIVFIEFTATW
jgi:hypothetical protein